MIKLSLFHHEDALPLVGLSIVEEESCFSVLILVPFGRHASGPLLFLPLSHVPASTKALTGLMFEK